MTAARFQFDVDLLLRLPRHADWKNGALAGKAWLSPRPRPVLFRRPTALSVQAPRMDAEARALDLSADRVVVSEMLLSVWCDEDPYRSLEAPADLLRSRIE